MTIIEIIKAIIQYFFPKPIPKEPGILIEAPKSPTDYVIGQNTLIVPEIIVPDGDWLKYLSLPYDPQFNGAIDELNCVSQAGINILEAQLNYMLMNNLLPPEIDYAFEQFFCNAEGYVKLSTRFNAKMAGTTKAGLKMTDFWDSVRSHTNEALNIGFVPLVAWPDPVGKFTWEEYYAEIPQKVKDFAKQVLRIFDVQYEWVVSGNCGKPVIGTLKQALQHAPLHVGAPSCPRDYAGIQRPCGVCQSSHARAIYAIDDYLEILDTYSPYLRKASLDYTSPYIIKGVIKLKT